MMYENNNFKMGLRDGAPIGLGYVAVSFAFGIVAVKAGLSAWQAILISMLNLTSAGQIAAVPIIATGGSLIELALTQMVINSRYALMSVSLSQILSKDINTADRFYIGFENTDEIFAVCCGKNSILGKKYLLGIVIFPFLGWTLGTALGAVAGDILPKIFVDSLSVSMYAMFVAILVPAAKKSMSAAFCILTSIAISCCFYYIPALQSVPSGFVIVIIAIFVSTLFAFIAPLKEEDATPEDPKTESVLENFDTEEVRKEARENINKEHRRFFRKFKTTNTIDSEITEEPKEKHRKNKKKNGENPSKTRHGIDLTQNDNEEDKQ